MSNPWEKIELDIYETHMASDDVYQLQTLNKITEQQLNDYAYTHVAILGIAGGNGLEYIDLLKTKKIYGIDVNGRYLELCKARYPQLSSILELIRCDLRNTGSILPFSHILICNLVIEYLGVHKFIELICNNRENVNVVTCIIQKNNGDGFVSSSNQSSAFVPLSSVHHYIDADELLDAFFKSGFSCVKHLRYPLPNGKEFIRMDFRGCLP